MEQRRAGTLEVWAEPFTTLRVPKLYNLRTDPFERADITSNMYWDWILSKAYIDARGTVRRERVPRHVQGVPATTEGGQLHHRSGAREDGRRQRAAHTADPGMASDDMVRVPGGTFLMGSDSHYTEESPAHVVTVDGFFMDRCQVTNHQFAEFVSATGYKTVAERPLDPADFPGAPAENLKPGSMVFTMTKGPVDLRHLSQWWRWTPGASWRHPAGPGSSLDGRGERPVVHVAYEDAEAYATWAGRSLPTEVEWEWAARGGLDGATFVWGDEPEQPGERLANYWHGDFPWRHEPGYGSTASVGSFPANGYGLHDMAGNVWEWTTDWWTAHHRVAAAQPAADDGGQLRPRAAAVPHPAQDDQGRLLPVRRQLLPALPTRRPATADGRHRHEPHRLPLRGARSIRVLTPVRASVQAIPCSAGGSKRGGRWSGVDRWFQAGAGRAGRFSPP